MTKSLLSYGLAIFLAFPLLADDPADYPGECKKNDADFNTEEGGCLEFSSGLVWSLGSSRKMPYAKASDYCTGLREAGRQGWRLPRRSELQAIAAERRATTYLSFRTIHFFWALDPGNSSDAWLVDLSTAERSHEDKATFEGAVVCVREPADVDADHVPDSSDKCNQTSSGRKVWTTGQWKGCGEGDTQVSAQRAIAIQREMGRIGCKIQSEYFKTEDGGCKDLKSGRVWSQVSNRPLDREAADRYCPRLEEGQQRGWQLPDAALLTAISGEHLASAHFKFATNRDFWSSSGSSRVPAPSSIAWTTFYYRHLVNLANGANGALLYYTWYEFPAHSHYNKATYPNAGAAYEVICVR